MQRQTDRLRAEHALVGRALQVLHGISRHVAVGGWLPTSDLALVLKFLREFLLTVHFHKESDHVWPALVMRGDDSCAAKVGELLRLQAEVCDLVHALMLFWEPRGDLEPGEREAFAETAAGLSSRVLRMQEIEEGCLFPAADAAVPLDDQLDWTAAFQVLEQGRRDWWPTIDQLAARWAA